ncbi:BsuBI/PstI family type II restriction endonuclease [Lentibacillus sp. N15]|uniref:BsuBI/PstI family type II restriction endonuclease n=1 Tax=Lentibacillus songyuanensis TaxID=3136161 RepID=UPI0031B9AD16
MGKLEEAREILKALGTPKEFYNNRGARNAYTFLALAGIKENDNWSATSNKSLRTVDMMNFMAKNYNKIYQPNSRENIRKDAVKPLVNGGIVFKNEDDNERATNSGYYSYKLTDEVLEVIRAYGSPEWDKKVEYWLKNHETLIKKYAQIREMAKIPVEINGQELKFSPGQHNNLQKEIIEEFAPRFAPGAEVLYVGDTIKKDLVKNREKLEKLGVRITDHDKLPDVVLYVEEKNWLYFIEAVTSVGPISIERMQEINDILENCDCGIVYVTAFLDMTSKNGFKKFISEIAWETEIWIANNPDHMIHLNGDKFFGPR